LLHVNFEKISKEAFQILQSFDYRVVMFDEQGARVYQPANARRFFAKPENLMLTIIDDGENSKVQLYLSKGTDLNSVQQLIDTLRTMATKYTLTFRVEEKDKSITPKDFASEITVSEQTRNYMNIVEGMYGTSRSSYLKLENARMIVRHSAKINENMLGARGRNIDSIFIENNQGERFRFPTTQLAPARAMAHHVDHGGSWADQIGEQISRMAVDFSNLSTACRHVGVLGGDLTEEAHTIGADLRECGKAMRRTFEGFCRKTRYAETCEAVSALATPLNEGEGDDLGEAIAHLGSILNTETASLSESVLRSVATVLEGRRRKDAGDPDAAGPEPDQESGEEFVWIMKGVLGRRRGFRLSTDAWTKLLKGQIDLFKEPELETLGAYKGSVSTRRVELGHKEFVRIDKPSMPNFKSEQARWCYYVNALAEACRDASMGNLLSTIAEAVPETQNNEDVAKMARVANAALKAAGIQFDQSQRVARTAEVREYQEWLNRFTAEALAEDFGFSDPTASTDHIEARVADIVHNFDPIAFLHSASASHYLYDEADRLDPEEKALTKDEVISDLRLYLEQAANDEEEFTGLNLDGEAEEVYPQVADLLTQAGYVIDANDSALGEGEDELSQEDVLLPSGQEEALFGEVTHDADGTQSHDSDEINRLLSLSGVHR
jgi:hypothetical protein